MCLERQVPLSSGCSLGGRQPAEQDIVFIFSQGTSVE